MLRYRGGPLIHIEKRVNERIGEMTDTFEPSESKEPNGKNVNERIEEMTGTSKVTITHSKIRQFVD